MSANSTTTDVHILNEKIYTSIIFVGINILKFHVVLKDFVFAKNIYYSYIINTIEINPAIINKILVDNLVEQNCWLKTVEK